MTRPNAFDMWEEAEALEKSWQHKWKCCLKFFFGSALGFFVLGWFNSDMFFYIFLCFLGIGFSAFFFVAPSNKERALRNEAVRLYGKDEEEYW